MTESNMTEMQRQATLADDHPVDEYPIDDHPIDDEGNTELGEISPLLTSASIIAALRDTVRDEIEKLSVGEHETSEAG
jgi:hypothetical protein